MRIGHNLTSINTTNILGNLSTQHQKSVEQLSSGKRINRAADDAAGLSISAKMRAQIRGIRQASRNAQDGISLIQTSEGALDEVHTILQRMNELSVQASNGSNCDNDRSKIQEEINQLLEEVDAISKGTTFNKIKLLDGSLANKAGSSSPLVSPITHKSMALKEILKNDSKHLNIIYHTHTDDFATTASGSGAATLAGHDKLKNVLQKEMVPQAVKGIIGSFSPAFDYLSSSSIGIGLELYSDASASTLASVSISVGVDGANRVEPSALSYNLAVNMASLKYDASGNLTSDSRTDLETTIVHEMVHAVMDEALTNGMVGISNGIYDARNTGARYDYQKSPNSYPSWFKEGLAQAASGGYTNSNDWVNGGLRITDTSTKANITSAVTSGGNRLSSGTTSSKYGTGYLASMYLGYLANGSSSVKATDISDGLGMLLGDLTSGKTLDAVINERTSGKYISISDFEAKFGDADSSSFIYDLTKKVGNKGNGGLITGNLVDNDLLPNTPTATSLFALNTTYDTVTNIYPSAVNVLSGGGSASVGTAPVGGYVAPPASGGGSPASGGGSSASGGLTLQIGASAYDTMTFTIESATAHDLGIENLSVSTSKDAQKAVELCYTAIDKVSQIRSNLGALQNRLEHTMSNLNNSAENLQASESRIRDLDMAQGMMEHVKYQILLQSSQAMLMHSNQSPRAVLSLLQ